MTRTGIERMRENKRKYFENDAERVDEKMGT